MTPSSHAPRPSDPTPPDPRPSSPTVFIVDDDPSARRGLTRLVRAAGFAAESFPGAKEFLESGKSSCPGCVVLDVRMPDMTGPELQEELCKGDYCLPVIFLSAHGDVPTTASAMKKGAVDFLTKPVDRGDLVSAIKTSLEKDSAARKELSESGPMKERVEKLTAREREIVTYVITGMLNKQIAAALDISEETVKIHRGRAMQKLAIESVADLVRMCERVGIEPAES